MKAISKEMKKRQKHFSWLKTFIKEFLKTYPNCKKTLQYLIENIEKEVKELKIGRKRKTKVLFETVNDLYIHFWWKIHWKQNSLWENYWNVDTPHSYQSSEMVKCVGKLLNLLIYLGIILTQGDSNSLWINRILKAINILPDNDEIVCDALLQLHALKKKYRSSYMEVLRHILCSEIILNISKPAVYVKSLMLLRRLKNFVEDEVAKASVINTASKIKPPSNLLSWLSSLGISVDINKSLVDQLLKKNSKQLFQNLYRVLIDDEHSASINKEKHSKLKKKSDSNEKGENLLIVTLGITDNSSKVIETPCKDINCNDEPCKEKNSQIKKVLHLSKLCNKIKNSKKKHDTMNRNINLTNAENKKSKLQQMDTKVGNLSKTDSQNGSTKSNRKIKPKVKTSAVDPTKNNETKSVKTSKKKATGSKSNKSKKKKKEIDNGDRTILDSKTNGSSNTAAHSNEAYFSNNIDSVLINSEFHTEESSQAFAGVNKEKNSKDGENSAIKKAKLTHSVDNNISQTDERYNVSTENSNDKISNKNDLSHKLPNLLANYEIYSSAEENETAKKVISSCPLGESGDIILAPDTCQNDFNSFVPFNLDTWVPTIDDASVSNDGSLNSGKHSYDSLTDIKRTNMYQNNQSDNSNCNDSVHEYINDSEVSRDTLISNDGSQFSDKYPYVSLTDIRKSKKWDSYQNSDYSNSSFDDSVVGNINSSEVSQDSCISYAESQVLDKNPYVSFVDIKKVKKNMSQKSDFSNSSYYSSFVGNISGCGSSLDTSVSNEESETSDKHPKNIIGVEKTTHCYSDSNCDMVLENVSSNEVTDVTNQNMDDSTCHDAHMCDNGNSKVENHHKPTKKKDSESLPDKTLVQSKLYQQNKSPCKKHSKTRTLSMEQDMVNTDLKTKLNSPAKRQSNNNIRKMQEKTNSPPKRSVYNTRKKQEDRKYSSDSNRDLVQPKKGKHCQESEASANDVNSDVYLNDLSTFLPNHGDIEIPEKESISPPTSIDLNHSDTQDLPRVQQHNTFHKESDILPHEANGTSELLTSCKTLSNFEEQPCIILPSENQQNNDSTCSIETAIDEFIESELSNIHSSCNNLNSVRLSDNVMEEKHTGSVHSMVENTYSPFQSRSNLVPSDCFNYRSDLSTPQQNNNLSNNMLSVSSSSTPGNRSIENEVAQSLLNLKVNESAQRLALPTIPNHRNENVNMVNANLKPGNSTYVVDCNIINDFDSGNSSRAGSSVGGETTTIKVVLNLINAKPENSSNPHNPNPSTNSFLTAYNSSQGLHSSVAPGQVINNSNCSFPVYRNNSYFSDPPFFTRTSVSELVTPPDSESHLRIPSLPRVQNMVPSCSNDKIDPVSSPKLKGKTSTPSKLSRKRQRNTASYSSGSANELQLDLNSSFSNIPSLHCEDVINTLNGSGNGNNHHSVRGNQNKQPISETGECSTSIGEKTALHNSRQAVLYRSSRASIYTDESEDDLSMSTMSLLSGEETDHSLIGTTDKEISPKSPPLKLNSSSKNKRKLCHEEKRGLNTWDDHSLTKSTSHKISPKSPLLRKKNQAKKLFREGKWALDSLTLESPMQKKSTVVEQPTGQKERRRTKVRRKKRNTSITSTYNLRSRTLLTTPAKLKPYIT